MGSVTMSVPLIDISPLIKGGDDREMKTITNKIGKACFEYGSFQINNHGMPIEVMNRAIGSFKTCFGCASNEEKLKLCPKYDLPLPVGYWKLPEISPTIGECFSMFPPGSPFNVFPHNCSGFTELIDEMYKHLVRIARVIESAINESLGLPENYIKEYNNNREWDLLTAFHYYPATKETASNEVPGHEDPNFMTLVLQDQTGGLEVLKDGNWIPVVPVQGAIVVDLGELTQVLSNDKIKSVTHRVVTRPGKDRHSFAFSYMVGMDKLVQPLPPLTINEAPNYSGFKFVDYMESMIKSFIDPPSDTPLVASISHFSLPK